jgi:putative membrane protein
MLWIKAFHIISVISWMAALLYLPRLFVYHSMSEDEISRERFKIMERKLLRGIANPAMDYYSTQIWYWCKLTLVVLLTGYHHVCVAYWKQLRDDRCTKSHKFFRVFNEVPVFFMIGIVIMVVVRPF